MILSVVSRLEKLCQDKGLKMTEQRRVIARVLSDADDHPDVEQLYRRASKIDPGISLATVYRTVRLFEEASILERHDFGDGRARYEEAPENHHDHLIDIQSGQVIEFSNEEIEKLQHRVAEQLGYKLVGHRLELYAVPIARPRRSQEAMTAALAEQQRPVHVQAASLELRVAENAAPRSRPRRRCATASSTRS